MEAGLTEWLLDGRSPRGCGREGWMDGEVEGVPGRGNTEGISDNLLTPSPLRLHSTSFVVSVKSKSSCVFLKTVGAGVSSLFLFPPRARKQKSIKTTFVTLGNLRLSVSISPECFSHSSLLGSGDVIAANAHARTAPRSPSAALFFLWFLRLT